MKRIENVAVIGMGALGLLFGDLLDGDGALSVGFIVDEARRARYEAETVCRLAARHGLEVPVNRQLYDDILKMEAAY